jgi:prefoldin subunit 5
MVHFMVEEDKECNLDAQSLLKQFDSIRSNILEIQGCSEFFSEILNAENRKEILISLTKLFQVEELLILFEMITKGIPLNS